MLAIDHVITSVYDILEPSNRMFDPLVTECGTFGEYQGPETHKTPKDIAMYLNSERPYPWVVDILFG